MLKESDYTPRKKDFVLTIGIGVIIFLARHFGYNQGTEDGYVVGYHLNPKIAFKQTMENYPGGIRGTGKNFIACDIKTLDTAKGEVVLHKCGFRYIKEQE